MNGNVGDDRWFLHKFKECLKDYFSIGVDGHIHNGGTRHF